MAISKNLPLLKNHFRKHWQERVKVHFNQAGKKASRRDARVAKAAKIAPRPLDLLRPVVRAPTIKYNRKVRAGRGFTFGEVKAAGLTPAYARTIGIAVDHRRQNKNQEMFELNVQRLKEYQSKIIVFPRNGKVPETEQVLSTAAAFPIAQPAVETETRAVQDNGESAYRTLRMARSEKRYRGIREKRAREKAEAEAEKKK
ncbi:similar to Saccharomyces cerevisiae YDL082W RPL13A Protein component of the large (60S) ribosomal subunit, nearly identical to Rpl13Bp [Maudiozyma saulgeensis]|uniref:60S ribosomal protein L13 n=1 Tax=Maudiozyma saulgeensis TaxID=1789683 RepID=A0A1X7QZH4_9SACH|nr:similar to Saccharomyces cerevisiae YDL082W RPL13A Protein component of the large (60S) ribosomal subunit, nearly identical to Rpl13Bp [Kazachstania saulgeensis]SMN19192.1 similar to Saccharomyces cerevisiae YDL082W RPL13A Protein component of the large (60S) ribosomal subunit, nearly identical to Rpl13Bp [Kazachstania saulgeensis]